MNEIENLWHECKHKTCYANFNGICRQPFMRCDKNIEIAFRALKEKQEREKMRCENCKYFELSDERYPCYYCSNCYINQFEPKERVEIIER